MNSTRPPAKTLRIALVASFLLIAPQALAKGKSSSASGADDPGCKSCLSQAATLFAANQMKQAMDLLASWSPRCPKNAQLHLLYSTILLRDGKNLAEAEKEALLAVAARPDSQAAHLQSAMVLMSNGRYQQAADEFKAVTELNPASYEAWSALADLYKRLRDDEQAKVAETRAANLEPGTRAVRLSVLNNLKRSANLSRAKKELQRLLQESYGPEFDQSLAEEALQMGAYTEAIEGATRSAKTYPNAVEPLRTIGLAQYLSHQYAAAEQTADKLIAVSPKSADGIALKALALAAQGKKQAAEAAAKAETLDPSNGFALIAAGASKLSAGEYEKAIDTWRACAATGPRASASERLPEALAHLNLYRLFRQQRALDDAAQEARFIGADPRFKSSSLGAQAIVLMETNSRPESAGEAARLVKEAADIADSAPEALLAQAYSQYKSSNFDQSRRLAEQAASIEPASTEPINLLVRIAISKGDNAEASSLIQKGLAEHPADPGLLLLKSEQLLKGDKAEEVIKMLLPLTGENAAPGALLILAEAYEKSGAKEEALKCYKRSTEGLGAEDAGKAKSAIKRLEASAK